MVWGLHGFRVRFSVFMVAEMCCVGCVCLVYACWFVFCGVFGSSAGVDSFLFVLRCYRLRGRGLTGLDSRL